MNDHATPPTLEGLRAKRDDILRVAALHRATNLRVFGSVVRGDASPRSDVDFLVDLPPDTRGFETFGILDELRRDLEPIVGHRVDVITIRGPSPDSVEMAATIEREALSL